ncbi:Ferric enterobactin transport protein FepE [Oligella sp. MSHR50489EDL]|uniref:LPS O-antigen chain length determinant protein WzzB n=1 Tax=Oligella sp. MSHR50489EDL TaxID=3139409 RepID=UPI003D81A43D
MVEQNSTNHASQNDEIDLFELFDILWNGKFLIILIAAIGFLAAYGVSLLLTQEWRSSSHVVAPRLANTTELIEKYRRVQRIVNNDKDVDINSITNNVFSTFLYTAANSDEKHTFLAQTDVFQDRMQVKGANATLVLEELSKQLSVQLPNDKQEVLAKSYQLSFVSDSAETAQKILGGYIAYISSIAIQTIQSEFTNHLQSLISIRKQKFDDIERNLQNSRKINIENITNALLTAQKAGIKSAPGVLNGRRDGNNNFVLEINPNPQQLYLQGEEILTALLDVEKNSPLTYPSEYYRLQYEIEALESLQDKQPEFQSFSYLMRPSLPPKRSSPKRALIAVIGGAVGGVLACLFVLIMAAFRNREKSLAQN